MGYLVSVSSGWAIRSTKSKQMHGKANFIYHHLREIIEQVSCSLLSQEKYRWFGLSTLKYHASYPPHKSSKPYFLDFDFLFGPTSLNSFHFFRSFTFILLPVSLALPCSSSTPYLIMLMQLCLTRWELKGSLFYLSKPFMSTFKGQLPPRSFHWSPFTWINTTYFLTQVKLSFCMLLWSLIVECKFH